MIDPSCKVKSVIMESFQNAAFLCEEYYDCAPDIEIKGDLRFVKYPSDICVSGQTMVKNEKGKKVGLSLVYPRPGNSGVSWYPSSQNIFEPEEFFKEYSV